MAPSVVGKILRVGGDSLGSIHKAVEVCDSNAPSLNQCQQKLDQHFVGRLDIFIFMSHRVELVSPA